MVIISENNQTVNPEVQEEIIVKDDVLLPHEMSTLFDASSALMLTIAIFVVAILARPILFLLAYVVQFGLIFGAIYLAVVYFVF